MDPSTSGQDPRFQPMYKYFNCVTPNHAKIFMQKGSPCPCPPEKSNPTGRGYSVCPMSLYLEKNIFNDHIALLKQYSQTHPHTAPLAPPQLSPRPFVTVGYFNVSS